MYTKSILKHSVVSVLFSTFLSIGILSPGFAEEPVPTQELRVLLESNVSQSQKMELFAKSLTFMVNDPDFKKQDFRPLLSLVLENNDKIGSFRTFYFDQYYDWKNGVLERSTTSEQTKNDKKDILNALIVLQSFIKIYETLPLSSEPNNIKHRFPQGL